MIRSRARARPAALGAAVLVAGLCAVSTRPGTAGAARTASPRAATLATREQADSAAVSPASRGRDQAMTGWALRAPLADLVWLLRRPPAELGSLELPLLAVALERVPTERASLRQRLLARRLLAAPHAPRKGEPALPDVAALRPYASVFRIAALFPDQGEYAGYGRALRSALAEGLAWRRPAGAPLLELDTLGTGDSDPERVAAAVEDAAARSDVVVGELLSGPTLSLATATRLAGLTLISPTATDERIGRVGPGVFQVGPGAAARARALADVVLGHEAHAVAIAGSAAGVRAEFAAAFARETEDRGGRVARRDVVTGNTAELKQLARTLRAAGVDVLFWDGTSRDAEALVRALATGGATLRVCGGSALAPEAIRPAARPLFEGVVCVDADWRLPAAVRAHLDSLASVSGTRAGALWTRGFLAGRHIAAAIDAGALTAGEVAAALRAAADPAAAGGFLDVSADGATLPVSIVRAGKAVPIPEAASDQ